MSFEEQTIGAFLDAKATASQILKVENIKQSPVSLDEAIIMQAASHLLHYSPSVYGLEIANLACLKRSCVYRILNDFEISYGLLVSEGEAGRSEIGRPRRLYSPTEIGGVILSLF
jgi:hypothetical protein